MKKFLSLVLSMVVILGLVACSQPTASTTSAPAADGNAAPAKLIMCTNAEFPPYEYKDGGKFMGIDVDCATLIGKKLGVDVEILDIAFDSLIPTVMSGKADFAMAGMTVTEDRKESVDFTHTYQKAVQAIVVPISSAIASADDLYEKKIGVQTGTTGDIYCSGDFGDSAIERYSKIIDGFQAMKAGKIDAVVVDDQVARAIVEQDATAFKVLETAYAEEEYAIAVKKGNKDLLNKLNSVIDEIKATGELQAIVNKYIQ